MLDNGSSTVPPDPASPAANRETPASYGDTPAGIGQRWNAELAAARQACKRWQEVGSRILALYKGQQKTYSGGSLTKARFNILWSNVQTLKPAIYSKAPKAFISRRHLDSDPVGLCASMILERAVNYEIEHYRDLHEALERTVIDRLLPGLGVAWVRFQADIVPVQQTDDATLEKIAGVKSCIDYVHWKDFLVSPAKTWEETRWAARAFDKRRDELAARFGESAKRFGTDLNAIPVKKQKPTWGDDEDAAVNFFETARVWEIWSKEKREVIWMAEGCATPLDLRPDPLQLEKFLPCEKPLFATLAGDSLVPTPDYEYYRDHAAALDDLTRRSVLLQRAIRFCGFYDEANKEIQKLLDNAYENLMIPVSAWQALMDKGGPANSIWIMDLDKLLVALNATNQAAETRKQTIYEITGLSDIVRGASKASETLGAQEIKAKFNSLRIQERQADMVRFAAGLIGIKAEVMARHYPPEVLLRRAAAQQLPPEMQQLIPQAMQLLKNEEEFSYRVIVSSNDMVELDTEKEKAARAEFLTSLAQFLPVAIDTGMKTPATAPLMVELLKFGVRGFRVGREVEIAIEQFGIQARQLAANPPPPPPSPEQVRAESAQAIATEKSQTNLALQDRKSAAEVVLSNMETSRELQKIALDNATAPEPAASKGPPK